MPEIKPIRGQIIEFQTAKRLFQKVIYSPRGYLVPRADGRVLIGATVEDAGFDKTVSDAATEFLRENAAGNRAESCKLENSRPMGRTSPVCCGRFACFGRDRKCRKFICRHGALSKRNFACADHGENSGGKNCGRKIPIQIIWMISARTVSDKRQKPARKQGAPKCF